VEGSELAGSCIEWQMVMTERVELENENCISGRDAALLIQLEAL